MMRGCAWVSVYASLYREWKWHLGEKWSGNPLTGVKSALICLCTTANLFTTIAESSVTVKEKEVRVMGQRNTREQACFYTDFTAISKTLSLLPSLLIIPFLKKNQTTNKQTKPPNPLSTLFFPLAVVISYIDRFQKSKSIWKRSYWPCLLLPLVMEEYGNVSTQRFIVAFSSGVKCRAGLRDCQHTQKAQDS